MAARIRRNVTNAIMNTIEVAGFQDEPDHLVNLSVVLVTLVAAAIVTAIRN